MLLIEKLSSIWRGAENPFLIYNDKEFMFGQLVDGYSEELSAVNQGDVVALIGDFNPKSIRLLLDLFSLGAVVVPLTKETVLDHDYFFEAALVNVVIDIDATSTRRLDRSRTNVLIESLRQENHAGLVLFSSGTTGRPKAILHDMSKFLMRYDTPRPPLRAINFLLFDHIGGINTLLHNLFNKGTVIAPKIRSVESVLESCKKYDIEVLPTTPTFLRMLLLSGSIPNDFPDNLKIVTYGTERMDQPTLDALCESLPMVDFRQTFGMSELGIVRVKSESRNSLYMKIGGEGVETKVVDNVLYIRSSTRMLGYLNADNPFDADGWYDTKDIVEKKNEFYKVTGRKGDLINVGGLKFMASEVERVALQYPDIAFVKLIIRQNPITGQHTEICVQTMVGREIVSAEMMSFLKSNLQAHMVPRRIIFDVVEIGHRFKKS